MTLRLVVGLALIVPSSEFRVPSELPRRDHSELGTRYSVLHDTHVSHTRMVLEGKTLACRVRLFKDDLEHALQASTGRAELKITDTDRADSVFAATSRAG